MSGFTIDVVLGISGEGTETLELEPGEKYAEVVGSMYVEIDVPELPEGPDEVQVQTVSTEEQDEESNGDREWKVSKTTCTGCGTKYPADYSRCTDCGIPNQSL